MDEGITLTGAFDVDGTPVEFAMHGDNNISVVRTHQFQQTPTDEPYDYSKSQTVQNFKAKYPELARSEVFDDKDLYDLAHHSNTGYLDGFFKVIGGGGNKIVSQYGITITHIWEDLEVQFDTALANGIPSPEVEEWFNAFGLYLVEYSDGSLNVLTAGGAIGSLRKQDIEINGKSYLSVLEEIASNTLSLSGFSDESYLDELTQILTLTLDANIAPYIAQWLAETRFERDESGEIVMTDRTYAPIDYKHPNEITEVIIGDPEDVLWTADTRPDDLPETALMSLTDVISNPVDIVIMIPIIIQILINSLNR